MCFKSLLSRQHLPVHAIDSSPRRPHPDQQMWFSRLGSFTALSGNWAHLYCFVRYANGKLYCPAGNLAKSTSLHLHLSVWLGIKSSNFYLWLPFWKQLKPVSFINKETDESVTIIFFTRNKDCVLPLYFCASLCLLIQTASFYTLWYKRKTFLFFHRRNKKRRAATKIISILEVEIHRRAAQLPFLIWRCFHLQSQLKREHS